MSRLSDIQQISMFIRNPRFPTNEELQNFKNVVEETIGYFIEKQHQMDQHMRQLSTELEQTKEIIQLMGEHDRELLMVNRQFEATNKNLRQENETLFHKYQECISNTQKLQEKLNEYTDIIKTQQDTIKNLQDQISFANNMFK